MEATAVSPTIRPINKGVVHRICAGQVILDLSSAVKQLVENSLDAGATSIEISLKDHGLESFQVIDNGCGISPNNFKVLALKHHTSKLADFPDLQFVTTFGFRGEALSSLCALGELTVETRTQNEEVATHLTFDRSGLLIAERKTARTIGTTVTVRKLFSSLPVRSKEFSRNIRKEYGKLISLLNAYALIAKGVRFVCTNTTGKNARSVVLKTQGSDSLKDNVITVLGMNTFNCLESVSICTSEDWKVDGYLSKPGQGNGRNLGDRQYYFVNGRPVDMPKVSKLVNELYRGANSRQYPIAVLNFTIPTRACDVNVTPDKRKIFFTDENSILLALREGMEKIYSPNNACYSVNKFDETNKAVDGSNLGSTPEKSRQLSEDGSDCEEIQIKAPITEGKDPATVFEVKSSLLRTGERMTCNRDEKAVMKDFALRVHGTKKVDSLMTSCNKLLKGDFHSTDHNSPSSSTVLDKCITETRTLHSSSSSVQPKIHKFITVNKRKHDDISTVLSEVPVLRSQNLLCKLKNSKSLMPGTVTSLQVSHYQNDDTAESGVVVPHENSRTDVNDVAEASEIEKSKYQGSDLVFNRIKHSHSSRGTSKDETIFQDQTSEEKVPPNNASCISPGKGLEQISVDHMVETFPKQTSGSVVDAPKLSSAEKIGSTLQFSFQNLQARRLQRLSRLQFSSYSSKGLGKRIYSAATLELSQLDNEERKTRALAAATTELERLFKKEDFSRMKVIGQFNLGFIIGKLDQDLFVVDQHAADEKYNFERLCQTTILNQQPLLRPLRLELSPEEEVVASMHLDIIRKNGFALEEDPYAPPGHHFKLKAVPFSKNITFGVEDVKDLIATLVDSEEDCSIIGSYKTDTADSVCPARVRSMLASRACQSSVMVGDPLGRNEMQKILLHLADLKSPWNCPHGRPTMRHLVDLSSIYKRSDETEASL